MDAETARDLLLMAASPPFVGVWALVLYAGRTLASAVRRPGRGWMTLVFGIVLFAWFGVFLALSTPLVVEAVTAEGATEPVFVILAFTWIAVVGVLVFLLFKTKTVCRYLVESYRRGQDPWPVARMRRWVER
jgi:FtsH-binding integral membrane protein